jgi:rhodanese-related sulfurtransferase
MFIATANLQGRPHRILRKPSTATPESQHILDNARHAALKSGLHYAGIISPPDAWQLFSHRVASLIDVRTAEERKFVGHVPHTLHVTWITAIEMQKNPRFLRGLEINERFLRELEVKAGKEDVILLLCRSGRRSAAAAEAATEAGFINVFNVAEGFEGELDEGQRGFIGGWRSYDLPWVQD